MTVAEVAGLLSLNQQTIRNYIDAGRLSAVRVGSRRVRIRREDLESFIAGQNSRPSGESRAHRMRVLEQAVAGLAARVEALERRS